MNNKIRDPIIVAAEKKPAVSVLRDLPFVTARADQADLGRSGRASWTDKTTIRPPSDARAACAHADLPTSTDASAHAARRQPDSGEQNPT